VVNVLGGDIVLAFATPSVRANFSTNIGAMCFYGNNTQRTSCAVLCCAVLLRRCVLPCAAVLI
jgi:hypothetical protein